MTARQELFTKLVARFPNVSTHALGRLAYKDSPAIFKNPRAAVHAAFLARNGNKSKLSKPYLAKTKFKPGFAFRDFPEGKTHFPNWGPIQFTGPFRALILQDIHIPYHDKRA